MRLEDAVENPGEIVDHRAALRVGLVDDVHRVVDAGRHTADGSDQRDDLRDQPRLDFVGERLGVDSESSCLRTRCWNGKELPRTLSATQNKYRWGFEGVN